MVVIVSFEERGIGVFLWKRGGYRAELVVGGFFFFIYLIDRVEWFVSLKSRGV